MSNNYLKAAASKAFTVFYGLALLKLLSLSLEPAEFSEYYLYFNACIYLGTFLFGIQWAVALRYYPILGKKITVRLTSTLTTASLIILLILSLLFVVITHSYNYAFILPLFIIAYGLYTLDFYYLRIEQDFTKLIYFSGLQVTIALILLLLFKEVLVSELALILISTSFLLSILLVRRFRIKNYIRPIKKDLLKNNISALKYSFPILFVGASNIMLSSMDQYFLNALGYKEELSAYIANYNIAEKSILVSLSIITLVFVPKIFNKYKSLTKDAVRDIINVELIFILLSLLVIIFLFAFNEYLTAILSNAKYKTHSWIIPYIGVGSMMLGVTSIMSEILTLNLKTNRLLYCYILGFIANFTLNFLFIEKYGVQGAITTTIISYLIMLLSMLYFVRIEYSNLDKHIVA